MKRRFCLLASVPLVLGACASDETADADFAADPATDAPAAAAPAETGMGTMPSTVSMSPLADSGVNGEAIVTPAGQQTEVSVTLSGLEANAPHPGHIHRGNCSAPGAVVVPLSEITADASGSGTMTTTASIPPDSAMAGDHIVVYHDPGGTPIVCGEITEHRM